MRTHIICIDSAIKGSKMNAIKAYTENGLMLDNEYLVKVLDEESYKEGEWGNQSLPDVTSIQELNKRAELTRKLCKNLCTEAEWNHIEIKIIPDSSPTIYRQYIDKDERFNMLVKVATWVMLMRYGKCKIIHIDNDPLIEDKRNPWDVIRKEAGGFKRKSKDYWNRHISQALWGEHLGLKEYGANEIDHGSDVYMSEDGNTLILTERLNTYLQSMIGKEV